MQHLFNQILLVFLWMSVRVQSKSLMFQPLDCADIYNDSSWTSGVHMIYPAGPNSGRYVYCDMYTDGGKWTVSNYGLLVIDFSSSIRYCGVWDNKETLACYFSEQSVAMRIK